jgi:transcriptional regulator with XRE-family HTH domain
MGGDRAHRLRRSARTTTVREAAGDVKPPHSRLCHLCKHVGVVDILESLEYKSYVAMAKATFYEELGTNLREARRKVHVTQSALANAVGLSRTSITNIEKGRQSVFGHVIAQMAAALGARLDTIVPAGTAVHGTAEPSQIQRLDPGQRDWVNRVLTPTSAPSEVLANENTKTTPKASTVAPGEAEGSGVLEGKRRASAARANRKDR